MRVETRQYAWEHKGKTYTRTAYLLMAEKEGLYGKKSIVRVNGASEDFLDYLNTKNCSKADADLKVLMEFRKHHLEANRLEK